MMGESEKWKLINSQGQDSLQRVARNTDLGIKVTPPLPQIKVSRPHQ